VRRTIRLESDPVRHETILLLLLAVELIYFNPWSALRHFGQSVNIVRHSVEIGCSLRS
jgi:hypothetical protein